MRPASFHDIVLKPILRERRWEQQQLAEAIGVDQSTVTKWITQGTIPTRENLDKLREYHAFDVEEWVARREIAAAAERMRRQGVDPMRYLPAA